MKKKTKLISSLREQWGNIKSPNSRATEVLEGKERETKAEKKTF